MAWIEQTGTRSWRVRHPATPSNIITFTPAAIPFPSIAAAPTERRALWPKARPSQCHKPAELAAEMERLTRALPEAEAEIGAANASLTNVQATLTTALYAAGNCQAAYATAPPKIRRQINQGFQESCSLVWMGVWSASS